MDKPDVCQLRDTELPLSKFPGGGRQPFRVALVPETHARIWKHANEDRAVEICGVLVGQWGKDVDGPFVAISESIRGEAATSKFAEVTFTHDTWARINHEMDTKFAGLAIVGWYHSHPDFGVFLSDRDLFIQQHFFSGPGQLAYVVDPVRQAEGLFIWREGRPVLAPYYWVGDRPIGSDAAQQTQAAAEAAPASKGSGSRAPVVPTVPLLDRLLPWLAFLALFLLGVFWGGRLGDAERNRLQREALAESALWLGIKPGLREGLEHALTNLDAASTELEALARAVPPANDEEAEKRKAQWQTTGEQLTRARQQLRALEAHYALTPAQTEQLVRRTAATLSLMTPGLAAEDRKQFSRQLEQYLLQDIKERYLRLPVVPEKKQ